MLSLGRIILATTTILAAVVSSSPLAQIDQAANLDGVVQPIETTIPETQAYDGVDPGPVPVPSPLPTPTPSPRYTAPVKIVSDL